MDEVKDICDLEKGVIGSSGYLGNPGFPQDTAPGPVDCMCKICPLIQDRTKIDMEVLGISQLGLDCVRGSFGPRVGRVCLGSDGNSEDIKLQTLTATESSVLEVVFIQQIGQGSIGQLFVHWEGGDKNPYNQEKNIKEKVGITYHFLIITSFLFQPAMKFPFIALS